MGTKIAFRDQHNQTLNADLNKLPDKCPLCQKHGRPEFLAACTITVHHQVPLHVAFRCPVSTCFGIYVALYHYMGGACDYALQTTRLVTLVEPKSFPPNIQKVSALFCAAYDQSVIAEANGLDQVCGPGFRKSLEFLVKDFLVNYKYPKEPEKQAEVRKAFLGSVIETHIDQDVIKQCAKRAAWLGNDETHYTRKWETKDISDLKSLIMMTVNYIDLVIESERYLREMPSAHPVSESPEARTVS